MERPICWLRLLLDLFYCGMDGNNNTVHGSDVRTTTSRGKLLETVSHDFAKERTGPEKRILRRASIPQLQRNVRTPTREIRTQTPDGGALARGGASQLFSKNAGHVPLCESVRWWWCRFFEMSTSGMEERSIE